MVAVRKATNVADLPFVYGSPRSEGIPDDLSSFQPPALPPGRPGAFLVVKAQFDAQKAIPHSKMVILRDIEKHPNNVHYNTAGQRDGLETFMPRPVWRKGKGERIRKSNRILGVDPVQSPCYNLRAARRVGTAQTWTLTYPKKETFS